jgi:hypothetical protein
VARSRSLFLIAGIACALLGGLWFFKHDARPREDATPPSDLASSAPLEAAPKANAPLEYIPTAEARSSQPVEASDAKRAPEPAALGEFLPYPSGGDAAFKAKYSGRSASELHLAVDLLRARIDNQARELMTKDLEAGRYEERSDTPTTAAFELPAAGTEPKGFGRTWKCTTTEPTGGSLKTRTVYLTEAAHPDLFEHQDEILWVLHTIDDQEHGR